MLATIILAIALLLVIEGIIPFLSPELCRRMMIAIIKCEDVPLRIMGLVAMLIGVFLMYLVHSGIIS